MKDPNGNSKLAVKELQKAGNDIANAKDVQTKIKSTGSYIKIIEHSLIKAIFGKMFYHYVVTMEDIEARGAEQEVDWSEGSLSDSGMSIICEED